MPTRFAETGTAALGGLNVIVDIHRSTGPTTGDDDCLAPHPQRVSFVSPRLTTFVAHAGIPISVRLFANAALNESNAQG